VGSAEEVSDGLARLAFDRYMNDAQFHRQVHIAVAITEKARTAACLRPLEEGELAAAKVAVAVALYIQSDFPGGFSVFGC
jgi:hypothetical protein